MQPLHTQLFDLLLIQLTNWRWAWRSTITAGLVLPVLGTLALSAFAQADDLSYILTGNLVLSLLFSITSRVSGNFAYMRVNGMLGFFASLPIYRVALIIATALAFLLLALPTVTVLVVGGGLLLHLDLRISPLVIVVVPLVGLSLCGLGAFIGTLDRPPEDVSNLTTLVNFGLLFVGPVLIAPARLHPVLQTLGYFSPTTYAASALRHVLFDQPNHIPLAVDVVMLTLVMIGLLWLSARHMDWRQDG